MPSEHAEQVTFVTWFRETYPNVLIFAIPNGEFRNISVAKRLKDEGVEKGIPDLFIPEWRTWIEMKKEKGGRLSPDQIDKISYLEKCNYTVIVAKGAKEAVNLLTNKLNIDRISV